MHVVITQVDRVHFDGEAESLTVPGVEGEMTILENHEPLITVLRQGEVTVRISNESQPRQFPIKSGVIEVRSDGATILI